MIAVSSVRPLDDSEEYRTNQLRAKESWERVFDAIIYYGHPDPRLWSAKTYFVECEDFPPIHLLAEGCAAQSTWAVLLNADIVVPMKLVKVEQALIARRACAAVSWRYEFDPAGKIADAQRVENDWGLDFFAATPDIWYYVAREIPSEFRIGHNLFDTWLLAFLNHISGQGIYDLTPSRVVFHPKHGGRRQPYPVDEQITRRWFGNQAMPNRKIRL